MQYSRRSTSTESRASFLVVLALELATSLGSSPRTAAQAPGIAPSAVAAEPIKQTEPIAPSGAKKRSAAAKSAPVPGKPLADEPPAPAVTEPARKERAPAAATGEVAEAPEPPPKAKPAAAKTKPKVAKGRKRRDRQPTPAYQKLRDSWHAPVELPRTPPLEVTGRVPLVLSQVNGGDVVTLVPQREDGGFSDVDLQRAATVFAPKDIGGVHPIAPRLLDLVYRAMRHFKVPMVHVVSGYRKDRAGSRHTQGRAIDMVLPGISNEALAEYVRDFGFCGVGIYPKSGFVHLDVRDRSYFWVDNSLPGERSRTTPILGAEAAAKDRAAAARGEAPDYFVPDNDAEDRAASKAYQRRAKQRRVRAERKLAREAQVRQMGNVRNDAPPAAKPKAQSTGPMSGFDSASVFGGLPP